MAQAANKKYLQQSTPSAPEYSITGIIKNVNPEGGAFLRYIPDELLSDEQIISKRQAVKKENEKLDGLRYEYAVEQKNSERVKELLKKKAAEKGYSFTSEKRTVLLKRGGTQFFS